MYPQLNKDKVLSCLEEVLSNNEVIKVVTAASDRIKVWEVHLLN